MTKKISKRQGVTLLALLIIIVLMAGLFVIRALGKNDDIHIFSLNKRDIAMNVNETLELSVVSEQKYKSDKTNVTWRSSDASVAGVDKNGVVTGVSGGETKIIAIIEYQGKEYSTSCIVTVKSPEVTVSSYKVRYYTQKQDRSGYDVKEETFERLYGSEVQLSVQEAKEYMPEAYYVLNEDKSILHGTVRKKSGTCILEIYYDVVEVTYYVDHYYESADKLGTYNREVTRVHKGYAFSEVTAQEENRNGFVANEKRSASVMKNANLKMGTHLSVYYDRVRTELEVEYCSNKAKTTYTNVYGVGLVNAPPDALQDDISPYSTVTYLNDNPIEDIQTEIKKLTEKASVKFVVSGAGFTYRTTGLYEDDGKATLVNTNKQMSLASYTYLQGSGKTAYLSATYNVTGAKSQLVGIAIKAKGEERMLYFQYQGVLVAKGRSYDPGTVSGYMYEFNTADRRGYAFGQNIRGEYRAYNSAVTRLVDCRKEQAFAIEWAIWNGTLYGKVDGQISVRVPLNKCVKTWDSDTEYQIGFAMYDGERIEEEFYVQDVEYAIGKKAEKKLVTDGQVKGDVDMSGMVYEPFTGSYLTTSADGGVYCYVINESGISGELQWCNQENSASAAGVTVKLGDKSIQYVVSADNGQVRRGESHGWVNVQYLNVSQVTNLTVPFDAEGKGLIGAFVDNGYLHITYNGVQAHCINLLSLFPEYTKDSEVQVGLFGYDTSRGNAQITDIKIYSSNQIREMNLTTWGYYSEYQGVDAYNFEKGIIEKKSSGWKEVLLLGQSDTWQIEGTMKRKDAKNAGDLLMGWHISSGGKDLLLVGQDSGFAYNWNYTYNSGKNQYAFGNTKDFFKGVRQTDELTFKAVLYKDVFYVWFDDVLCWRVPLTETQFGFTAGSDYNITLSMADPDRKAAMEDIKVLMGYQVTEQKNFDIASLSEQIVANITRWNNMNNAHLTGRFADGMQTDHSSTISQATIKGTKGNQAVQTVITLNDKENNQSANGFLLKTQRECVQILLRGYNDKIEIQYEEGKGGEKDIIALPKDCNLYDKNGRCQIEAVLKEGVLYLVHIDGKNATQIGNVKLNKLFKEYNNNTKIALGVYSADTDKGTAVYTGITFFGEDYVSEFQESTQNVWENVARDKFLVANKTEKVSVDKTKGNITINGRENIVDEVYFAHELSNTAYAETWEISGTIERQNPLNRAIIGFSVKDSSGKIQGYDFWDNHLMLARSWPWGAEINGNNTTVWANADVYRWWTGGNSSMNFKLTLKDDVLQLWINDSQVWKLPITDVTYGGFDSGSVYQIGVHSIDPHVTYWKNVTVKSLNEEKFDVADTSANVLTDTMNGTVTINGISNVVDSVYLTAKGDGNQYKTNWEVTGTIKRQNPSNRAIIGFSVKDSSGKIQGYDFWDNHLMLARSWPWGAEINGNNTTVWANADVYGWWTGGNSSMNFKLTLKDDVLQLWINGSQVWKLPITDTTYGGFASGSTYQIGFHSIDPHTTHWTNIRMK